MPTDNVQTATNHVIDHMSEAGMDLLDALDEWIACAIFMEKLHVMPTSSSASRLWDTIPEFVAVALESLIALLGEDSDVPHLAAIRLREQLESRLATRYEQIAQCKRFT